MAYDKAIDSVELDADLTTVADAIRAKGETTEQLVFPTGFKTAIENIKAGGGVPDPADPIGYYRAVRPKNWPPIALPNEMTVKYGYGRQELLFEINVSTPMAGNDNRILLGGNYGSGIPGQSMELIAKYYKDTEFISEKIYYPYGIGDSWELNINDKPVEANFLKLEIETKNPISSSYAEAGFEINNRWNLFFQELSEKIITPSQSHQVSFVQGSNTNGPVYISIEGRNLYEGHSLFHNAKVIPYLKNISGLPRYVSSTAKELECANFINGDCSFGYLDELHALKNIPCCMVDQTTGVGLPSRGAGITKEYFVNWFKNLPQRSSTLSIGIPTPRYGPYRLWISTKDIEEATQKGYTITE